jgi:hypothetical protein
MAIKNCPKCQREFNGGRALKEHMSAEHGGFSQGDIPSDGNKAKDILGSSSLDELAGKAPADDAIEPDGIESPKKTGRPKKNAEEIAAAERRKLAMDKIGGVITRKVASVPYVLWAAMASNDSLRLTKDEQKELADAYLEIARGYDADFSSPFFGVFAAIAINAEFVAKRMGLDLSGSETPAE